MPAGWPAHLAMPAPRSSRSAKERHCLVPFEEMTGVAPCGPSVSGIGKQTEGRKNSSGHGKRHQIPISRGNVDENCSRTRGAENRSRHRRESSARVQMNPDRAVKFPHVVAIHDVEGAVFRAADEQMRLRRSLRNPATRTGALAPTSCPSACERRLIAGSEIIGDCRQSAGRSEAQETIAVTHPASIRLERPVSRHHKNIVV